MAISAYHGAIGIMKISAENGVKWRRHSSKIMAARAGGGIESSMAWWRNGISASIMALGGETHISVAAA
jgi:hypothetical protein